MAGTTFSEHLGLLRSWLIYYGKPLNRRRLIRFYNQFVRKGDLCFDLGAHLGNRTDAWLRMGAKVVAVDPQPVCIAYLKKYFANNPQFTLVPKAIGERPGVMQLHVSEKTPTISTLAGEKWQQVMQEETSYTLSWDRSIEVEVITLDHLVQLYGIPAFCKIDVEAFELQVLHGLSQPLPCLSFEYFSPTVDRAIQCIERLTQLGNYQYNWSIGESQRLEQNDWLTAEGMIEVFTRDFPAHQSGDVYARLVVG